MVRLIAQEMKCPQGEILFAGEGIVITAQLEIIGPRQGKAIVEVDGHEDGGDVVKAVIAATNHLQTEIQLGRSVDDDLSLALIQCCDTKKVSFWSTSSQ